MQNFKVASYEVFLALDQFFFIILSLFFLTVNLNTQWYYQKSCNYVCTKVCTSLEVAFTHTNKTRI